ncbi:MAG TPA: polysaccharide biosynthesis C-terminal domain-containing protein [Candidatus Sulfotelmatobacter sp.]|nr:polysaccharide biosynthesis C-terminal domain-containing protein [Candidatus Sulfotelmatobacter sp.]
MGTQTVQLEARSSSFLAGLTAILGGQAANVLLAFLSEVCVARILGPGPRGQISVATMAIWFGAVLGGLGGEIPIVIWAAARNKKTSEWLSVIAIWGLLGCCVAELIWWLVYSRWHATVLQGLTADLLALVTISIPVAIVFNYLIALLTGLEQFRGRAVTAILQSAVGLLAFLLLVAIHRRSAASRIWGNWIGLAASALFAVLLLRKIALSVDWKSITPRFDREVRSALLVGLYGNFGNVASLFTYRLDVFVVNYFLDPTQVGLYAVGVTVSESLWQIPQAVATAVFPRTARTVDGDAASFTCLLLRQVLLLSCISGAALAVASPVLIPAVFGRRFAPSVPVIWWLLPGTIALGLGKIAASDLAGRGKTGYSSVSAIVALLLTLTLDLLLIPRMGIQGAALASSLAYMANSTLLLAATRFELKVRWSALLLPSLAEFTRYKELWRNLEHRALTALHSRLTRKR